MKFEIKNRFTGAVKFTAEFECEEGVSTSIKLGLAVKCAAKAGANLANAYLANANLANAYLANANLANANLANANLANANLANANLAGAYLAGAYLANAYLANANLAGANLANANLADAYLAGAYLANANLNGLSGLNDWVKCIQIEDWPITYTSEVMQIGCQRHSHEEWRGFSDAEIRRMDGMKALKFWRKWREMIFKIVEMAPALPTKTEGSQCPAPHIAAAAIQTGAFEPRGR